MNRSIRIQAITVIISLVLMILKGIAYIITDSNAILSDALESIVNVLAGTFALYSLYLASRPKDKNHPYGHGKIEFISASLEGGMIFFAGLIINAKAIRDFFINHEIDDLQWGIYLTTAAGVINFIMGRVLIYQGKKNDSLTMEADGHHLSSDAYSTAGMIIGLMVIYFTGMAWIDNLIALLFGCLIMYMGVRILKRSIAGIMDEADMDLLKRIVQVAEENRKPEWIDLHNLRVIKFGSLLHLDCHMTVPWYNDVKTAHGINESLEELIRGHFGEKAEMFVHMDPCKEQSCPLCTKTDCEVRKHALKNKVSWTLENVLQNKQHTARAMKKSLND